MLCVKQLKVFKYFYLEKKDRLAAAPLGPS